MLLIIFFIDEPANSPLQALSKMVPVPESLMSPDYRPPPFVGKTSSTVLSAVNNKKLSQTIRSPKLARNLQQKNLMQTNNEGRKSNSSSPARTRKVMGHQNNTK